MFTCSTDISPRVDFLGPPGIGKTTLCDAVIREMSSRPGKPGESNWVSLAQAGVLARGNARRMGIPSIPFSGRPMAFLRLVVHGLRDTLGRGIPLPLQDTGRKKGLQDRMFHTFLEGNHGLVEALAEHWFDPDMNIPPRAIRYDEMMRWIRDWLFTLSCAGPVKVLADNSRLTRGIAEVLSNEKVPGADEVALGYIRSPLRPAGVIHLVAPAELVVKRIRQRGEEGAGTYHPAHHGLDDAALLCYCQRRLAINERAITFFESQQVPTLRIEADARTHDSVRLVLAFLHGESVGSRVASHVSREGS